MPIIMSGAADSSKSVQDNLKTVAYTEMHSASVNHSVIVTTTMYPFSGATNK